MPQFYDIEVKAVARSKPHPIVKNLEFKGLDNHEISTLDDRLNGHSDGE
jgi:hypothetical protein